MTDGKLYINEEEAAAIRVIFDQYVNTDIGANGVAKDLENYGIHKIQRQNGKNSLFDAHLVRIILKNPVYCGKIAYGRRKTEKVHAVMNEVERRQLMETLISEMWIYDDRQPNGQFLKSIKFKLPIVEEDMEMSLDDDKHVEGVPLYDFH